MSSTPHPLTKLLEEAREHLAYKTEGSIIEFTEELCRVMQQTGCTKTELANRLGCKPAYITKLLSGENNFTIETMVKVAAAVGAELRVHLQPVGTECEWVDHHTFDATATVEAGPGTNVCFPEFGRSEFVEVAARSLQKSSKENGVPNEELALAA